MTASLRIVKQSRFKHLEELHKEWTEAGVSASRVTTLRHLQEKGYQATSELETFLKIRCKTTADVGEPTNEKQTLSRTRVTSGSLYAPPNV